jgi:hypothetical protein
MGYAGFRVRPVINEDRVRSGQGFLTPSNLRVQVATFEGGLVSQVAGLHYKSHASPGQ